MFILLVVISLILLASGLWMFYSKMILEKYGVKAVGRVIRNEKFIDHTVDSFDQIIEITVYRPVIEFETEDGLKLQAVCDEGSNPPIYKEGDFINIVYPSNDPKGFEVNDYPNTLKLPIILISLSIMLLVFAIVLIII